MSRCLLLLLVAIAGGTFSQTPGIIWHRTYYSGYSAHFFDVHETQDGGFIIAGRRGNGPGADACVFRTNSIGSISWTFGFEDWWSQAAFWIEELPDNGFIVTGGGKFTAAGDIHAFLLRLDENGSEIWSKTFTVIDVDISGNCLTRLPDGGYALCGEKNPETGMDQAWILRTDANGDTLWTREWGWDYNDEALRIIYEDNGLSVLIHGRLESTSGGPHIVHYDLDGNLLWETPIPDLYGYYGRDMCAASDSGYIVLSDRSPQGYSSQISHVDSSGSVQWTRLSGCWLGHSVNQTMDGGYIVAAEFVWIQPELDYRDGVLVKLDSDGNYIWSDTVEEGDCDGLDTVRQLSQGGYIAGGKAVYDPPWGIQAYLIRYEPEVGIEAGEPPHSVQLDILPNPFSSSLSISYTLPEPVQIELSVYDLSGRVVDDLEGGSVEGGYHTEAWNPDLVLPNGCYLIVLDACGERDVRRCVLLR